MSNFSSFKPTATNLFFTRNDKTDPRLGELVSPFNDSLNLSSTSGEDFVIAGYPDDEGIKINGGRIGAAQAPDQVRTYLYKMTPALQSSAQPTLYDLGNLNAEALSLSERHQQVRAAASNVLASGACWLSIGGGHDYGFPDAAAFLQQKHAVRPLVINFDAHLDVRPTDKGLSSGTPFYRMLEEFPDTDFVEIGIQGHCNSKSHLQWLKERKARVLTMEEVVASGESLLTNAVRLMEDWLVRPRPTFISIDIDGFSNAVAMGCSQSWATGFDENSFFALFNLLIKRLKVQGLGIYEVSPPLDQDNRTAKLAAQILHRRIYPL